MRSGQPETPVTRPMPATFVRGLRWKGAER